MKKYSIDDIYVCIMTHNRSCYLEQTILCLLNQTVKINEIVVYDNERTDNTEEIVKKYASSGVRYVKTYGFEGNFHALQKDSNKEYTIHCHDDNLLHPQFFERVLFALNCGMDVSCVTSTYNLFSSDNNYYMPEEIINGVDLYNSFIILDSEYAFITNNIKAETSPWPKVSPSTPFLVYKTSILKARKSMTHVFGKADDLYLYLMCCQNGVIMLLNDSNACFIRQHAQRDLFNDKTALSLKQFYNVIRLYVDVLIQKKINKFYAVKFFELLYLWYPVLVTTKVTSTLSFNLLINGLFRKGIIPINYVESYNLFCKSYQGNFFIPPCSKNKFLKTEMALSANYKKSKNKLSYLLKCIFSIQNTSVVGISTLRIMYILGIRILLNKRK